MSTGLEKLLRDTAGLSRELLLEASLDGTILEVNPAWTALLGWSESDLRGKAFRDLVHPDDLEKTREEMTRATQGKAITEFDNRCRHEDGSYRSIAWLVLARENRLHAAGQPVTAQLTSRVAHDFNNLLQSIVASLELVRKLVAAGRSGETERFIAAAIGSAQRAAELNQRLLDSSSPPRPKDDR